MASVEYLIKQFLSPDKKVLDLSNQVLGDKGAMALAKSKHLKRVVRLTLANNNISDEGAIAIANSEKFKKLTELDFYGNVISDDGVKAIAESPSMANLKKLNLYGNLVEDEGAIVAKDEDEVIKIIKSLPKSDNQQLDSFL